MEGTKQFKEIIKNYLEERAKNDEMFAKSYAKENKSIEGCVNYIFQEVKKSGCCGFADEEIFGMAVHYYDEDDVGGVMPKQCRVVVNRTVPAEKKVAVKKEEKVAEPKRVEVRRKPAVAKQMVVKEQMLFDFE
jgi:prolyl-tRNA synthetase